MGDFFPRKTTEKVRKVNLKAPRVKKTFYNTLNKQLFETFLKEYPQHSISWWEFKNIVITSNKVLTDLVVENRDGLDFPSSLGKVIIGACNKKKDKNYDWVLSSKHEIDVEHKNWESNKYLCKIFYSNFETKYKFPLMNHWTFAPSREFQRKVSHAFKKNWNLYWKVPSMTKIGKLDREEGMRSIKIKKNEKKGTRMDFSDTQPE